MKASDTSMVAVIGSVTRRAGIGVGIRRVVAIWLRV